MVKSILLIDDDSDDSDLFSEALEALYPHIKFSRAIDGFEALEMLRKKSTLPDLIFLDINMPRMNGWECLAQLKKEEQYKDIPVIMYSTSSHVAEEKKATELGAKTFISKPDNFGELKNVLRTAIGFIEKRDLNIKKRNNVKILGKGKQPMVFAHGFGCNQTMWRYTTPAFENDYKVILFDYVGAGKSEMEAYDFDRYSTLSGYVEDVTEICDDLKLSDVIFVGHSVSSMIGLLAAVKRPELFSDFIFVGGSAMYVNEMDYVGGFEKKDILELLDAMKENYIRWANLLAPVVMKNPERPELKKELEESFTSTDPDITRQFAKVTFLSDNRKNLSRMKHPSLLIQSSDDVIVPKEASDYLHNNIQGSVLKILNATGHYPQLSAPRETVEAIKHYLGAKIAG